MKPILSFFVLVTLVFAFALQPAPARADDGASSEAAYGASSAVLTLLYGPAKVANSALGLIFGGFAYGLSGGDADVMDAVITPAIRGDYVVTPSHLQGDRQLEFIGRNPEYREAAVIVDDPYY